MGDRAAGGVLARIVKSVRRELLEMKQMKAHRDDRLVDGSA